MKIRASPGIISNPYFASVDWIEPLQRNETSCGLIKHKKKWVNEKGSSSKKDVGANHIQNAMETVHDVTQCIAYPLLQRVKRLFRIVYDSLIYSTVVRIRGKEG